MSPSPASLRPLVLLQIWVALIWGGTWIAGRIVAAEVAPMAAAVWRFALGSTVLAVLVWRAEGRLPSLSRADALRVLALGSLGICAYNLFFFYGLQHVQAGRAAMVVALNPVAVALGAWLVMGEKLSPLRLLGIALALLGCLTVIGRGHPLALLQGRVGAGELLILGCVASWALYTLLGRKTTQRLSPLVMTFYASLAGGGLLWLSALVVGVPLVPPHALSLEAALAVAYLGILGSGFSYVWFARGVQGLGATRAAAFINLVPLFALLLSALLLGERFSLLTLGGGALILAGVTLTHRATQESR